MSTSQLSLLPAEIHASEVVLRGRLQPPASAAVTVEFRLPAMAVEPGEVGIRPFLFAFLVPAMRLGTALRLPRPIDPVTAANLMEWQEAMASWHPSLRVVPILADLEPTPPRPVARGALTAFSGGVDSCFSAWRHRAEAKTAGYRKAELRAGVMIHGFDIPLGEADVFEAAWENSAALLRAFGLEAFRASTDVRKLYADFGCNWETETHGIWLAAVLSCFEQRFEQVLIPSTYAYPKPKFPWGSNPVTDPLLSSDVVAYWHDGAAFTKLTKVRAIAAAPLVSERIRVCWEGERLDRNCGRCFKCVVTQVCFQLAGVPLPVAFPSTVRLREVARLPVKNEQNAFLVRSLRAAAVEAGDDALAAALGAALRRAFWRRVARKLRRTARSFGFQRPPDRTSTPKAVSPIAPATNNCATTSATSPASAVGGLQSPP